MVMQSVAGRLILHSLVAGQQAIILLIPASVGKQVTADRPLSLSFLCKRGVAFFSVFGCYSRFNPL